jgi:hypothetical protein
MFCILCGVMASAKPQARVLVLGFDSRQINDVQDRLLREAVMRRLQTDGYRIVPVMEIESVFNEDRKGNIRKLAPGDIRWACEELNAGFALSGSIAPEDGMPGNEIITGKKYICSLVLFRKEGNRSTDVKVTVAGGENLLAFYNALSALVVEEMRKLL